MMDTSRNTSLLHHLAEIISSGCGVWRWLQYHGLEIGAVQTAIFCSGIEYLLNGHKNTIFTYTKPPPYFCLLCLFLFNYFV
jgi:hypothetical protein